MLVQQFFTLHWRTSSYSIVRVSNGSFFVFHADSNVDKFLQEWTDFGLGWLKTIINISLLLIPRQFEVSIAPLTIPYLGKVLLHDLLISLPVARLVKEWKSPWVLPVENWRWSNPTEGIWMMWIARWNYFYRTASALWSFNYVLLDIFG